MPYPIQDKLVVAIASSALFDLSESDRVFRERGVAEYRRHQREHEHDALAPGVAFPFVRRLLALGDQTEAGRPAEVVLLSRNDPDTGLRVFRSIQAHSLPITRAAFVNGGNPFRYMNAFNASLFLSANEDDVRRAVERGLPAGRVFQTQFLDSVSDMELRVAFDFDGVIADDSAESVFKLRDLEAFQSSEANMADKPMPEGPLARLFKQLGALHTEERERAEREPGYKPVLRTAIITARNAPAHERVVTTLRAWGIEVDEVFFLGGIEKRRILAEFKPHLFFDDQLDHVKGAAGVTPCVHVPFGVANMPTPELIEQARQEFERAMSAAKDRPPSSAASE